MKKLFIIIAIVSMAYSGFSQTLMLEEKALPAFKDIDNIHHYKVANLKALPLGFTDTKFKYLTIPYPFKNCTYYLCYDNQSASWICFAIHLKNDSIWHINSKFIHLLIF